ncbi:HET-domain-containing protein [Annulohypoxylon maeteangense]|uniref:HET-domain-containing protein n=1 Tax=Annulohypoxylon maeteangense TaxID=1927788 RepID=UPI00200817D7|nr:HET-domain-containing protein [Annulohypoxylon maeteangense]KAI0888431.1 HET-domain-containing protein [Annulohypoxylon maeteangense]
MVSKGFGYTALDSSLREIRVLTVLPGSFNEPLRVTLDTLSLGSKPIYNALSYVWGDASSANTPGNTINIDGHDFPVTTNLLSALRHLRSVLGAVDQITLWVDAVCINQADLDERAQQVSMMRDIYASAEQVIIWLGEEDNESDAAFDSIPVLAAQSHTNQDEGILDTARLYSRFLIGLAEQRPWLSRVWIIQELAMARNDPLVVCGHKSVPWSTFMKASEFVSRKMFTEIGMVKHNKPGSDGQSTPGENSTEKVGEEDIEITAKWKIDVLDDLYKSMRSKGGDSLRNLLFISRTSEATDPRDRVYALLGLLKADSPNPQSPDNLVEVDYRKPTAAVYTDAMAHIFAQGDGPYFLSCMFLPGISAAAPQIPDLPTTIPQPTLPSWVLDFSKQTFPKATQLRSTSFHPPAGITASGAGANCNNGKRLDDKRTLQVEGLFVDTIEDVIAFGSSLDSHINQLAQIESLAKTAKERPCMLEPAVRPYIEQFKNKEPLWRALVSNKRFNSGYDPAPISYEAMHQDILKSLAEGHDWKIETGHDQENEYIKCLKPNVGMKSFFTTTSGFVGTCVPDSRKGDVIAILFGSPVPFVLRPGPETIQLDNRERPTHFLIGASYVSGIMDGEMVDELYCEDIMDSTTFFIR